MASLLYKYVTSDTTLSPPPVSDSVNIEEAVTPDTIITDSVILPPDSFSIPAIVKYDSAEVTPDTVKVQPPAVKKTITEKPSIVVESKAEELPLKTKPQTSDTSENFLILLRKDTSKYLRNSILKTHSNKLAAAKNAGTILPHKRIEISNDWYLGIILFIIILFMWIKIFYKKYFTILFSSLLNYQASLKLLREKSILTKRVSFALNLIYIIVFALFLFKILEFYQINLFDFNKMKTLLFLVNLIIIISIGRILLLNIIGIVFNSINIINEYIHNNYVINKNLGLFLFPLLITQVYMTEKITVFFIISGIILIILSHIIRLYRGFQILIKKDIFLFYLILYLCTLEILPLLLGYKFFISLI